jgi:hypothetical protein
VDTPKRKSLVIWIDPIRSGDDFATSCRGRIEDVSTSARVAFAGMQELLDLVERFARPAPAEARKRGDHPDD